MQEVQKKAEYETIPSDWTVCQVRQVGQILTGSTPDTSITDYYGREFLWATPIDMGSKKYVDKTTTMLSKKGFEISRHVPRNAILVVCIGSTIGKVGMAYREMSTNQQINSIICTGDYSEFIYYQLLFNQRKIRGTANQVAIPILNKEDFGVIKICKPNDLKEQQKIASILSKVDELIQKTDQVIEQTRRLKKGLMQRLLTKGIGHNRFKKVNFAFGKFDEIPEEWDLLEIDRITESVTYGLTIRPNYVSVGIPLISAKEIGDGEIDFKNAARISKEDYNLLSKKERGKKGDVFYSKTGTIGLVARAKVDSEFAITQNIASLTPKKEIVLPEFLELILRTNFFFNSAYRTINTTTLSDLQLGEIRKIRVPIPNLNEQNEINCIIVSIYDKIRNIQTYKLSLENLKEGLLQQLLTGKIRVKV